MLNIRRMKQKTIREKVIFRPHFKTHQSSEVASWFMQEGIDKITVSSVSMAFLFAEQGFHNITIAFPCNIREIESINHLGATSGLNLLVDSAATAGFLSTRLYHPTGIFIEIDTGYHRSGLDWQDQKEIRKILNILDGSDKAFFKGFLTHSGDTYHAGSRTDILEIFENTRKRLQILKNKLNTDAILSIGDTPSCSLAREFGGIDEIRPGNFVYYDLMQHFLGVCSIEEIAAAMACPIVSVYPERNEMVIYGGAVHFSKDSLTIKNNKVIYGLPVKITESGWGKVIPGSYLTRLSQEHGIIEVTGRFPDQCRVGDLIGIIPVHSCLTANLMRERTMILES